MLHSQTWLHSNLVWLLYGYKSVNFSNTVHEVACLTQDIFVCQSYEMQEYGLAAVFWAVCVCTVEPTDTLIVTGNYVC